MLDNTFFEVLRNLLYYGESSINISNYVKEEFEDFGLFESLEKLSLDQNHTIAIEAENIIDTFWGEEDENRNNDN